MDLDTFTEKLNRNERPVVIDFWAPWCTPCRHMEAPLEQMSKEYHGRVDLWKINVDESPDIARSLRIMAIPTLAAYAGGEQIQKRTGVQSAQALAQLFENALAGKAIHMSGPAPFDRLIRSAAGIGLIIFGLSTDFAWLPVTLGAVLLFSAFYDRCPIFRSVRERLAGLRRTPQNEEEG